MGKWVIIGAFFCYILSTLWLTAGVPHAFVSPDENANFAFATQFRTTGTVALPEPVNPAVGGVVHGRSVVPVGDVLLPGSFLGMPLVAGALGWMTFGVGVQLLTPLLLVLMLCAWYGIVRRVWGDTRLALVATILVAVHPAIWYYGARSMMHNVPFVACVVIAAWFGIVQPIHQRTGWNFTLAGIMLGVALFFRTSEIVWVTAATAGLLATSLALPAGEYTSVWLRCRARFCAYGKRAACLAGGYAVVLIAIFSVNVLVYGGPLTTGYTVEDGAFMEGVAAGTTSILAVSEVSWAGTLYKLVAQAGSLLLPFGFHEYAILHNVWNYGVAVYPWMSALALAGMLLIFRKSPADQKAKHWRTLLLLTLGLAAWLGIVYGSWVFNDNPDPRLVTIGDSHVRYWLPLFVLASPFSARAVLALTHSTVWGRKRERWLQFGIISMVTFLSGTVVFGGLDGLFRARTVLFEQIEKRNVVLAEVNEDAIVIVDRADKFLFPYTRVVQPLRSDATFAAMPAMVRRGSLYYLGIPFPPADMTYMNDVLLAPMHLQMEPVVAVRDEMLYRIVVMP